MAHRTKLHHVALGLLVATALGSPFAAGCVALPEEGKPVAMETRVEDWRDEVIYQVLVDRFANGDVNNDWNIQPGALARFQGGDWRGLEDNLDYLEDLGVTSIWISPVVKNVETDADVDSYHGYWAQDLTDVNPHFGDLSTLRSFIRAAHRRNMKVILDVVTNHMGQVFFYDMNLNGKPDIYIGGTGRTSPVERVTEYDPDWDPRGVQAETSLGIAGRAPLIFINDPAINRVPPKPGILGTAAAYHGLGRIINYNDPRQVELGDFPGGLKDVATENPEVREVMIDVFARWVELVDFDGFRIDTVKHVEHEFWSVWTQGVRSRLARQGKTNFFMFGEAYDGNDQLLGSYTVPGELDSVFYFSQHFQVFNDVFQFAHNPERQAGTDKIERLWNDRVVNYGNEPQPFGIGIPPYKALVNFIDNHDRPRFLFDARYEDGRRDLPALRNALTLLMTEEGIPCVYYGTEQDFDGGNDPANREVLWETGFKRDGETFRHISNLAKIRRAYAALRRGDTVIRYATSNTKTEPDAGMFAFERTGGGAGDRYALVVLNTNAFKESATATDAGTMKVGLPEGTLLIDVLSPERPTFTVGAEGALRVSVPAQSGRILVPANQIEGS
jgi:glycosidase